MLAPGLFFWWSGRHLVRHRDDPALPERIFIRQQHGSVVVVLSAALLAYSAGSSYWLPFIGLLAGSWCGDYPSRRVLFDEQWTLGGYVVWHARFTTGYFGFWLGLLIAPALVHAAGAWRWPAAVALALLLGLWGNRYGAALLWLVRAQPLTPPAAWEPILERSHARRPRLRVMPVPGGRFVNAFALPSTRDASVLFSAPLLELLDAREQAAILAHEMAHLEHYDRRRCRTAAVAGSTLVALATLGAALALDWFGGGRIVAAWSAVFVLAFAIRVSRHKSHETESDLRALALCQDAEALISGLTKLTIAGRMPRRWSSEVERHASHPSLARRLQAIRRAAGLAPEAPPATDVLVIRTAAPGARVILDDRGVSWLGGLGAIDTRDPGVLRQMATASWAVPYAELTELRVAASWWGGAALRVRDRAGTSRTVRIAAADVRALQQRLDTVEDRLPHDAAMAGVPVLASRFAALGLVLASIGSLLPLGLLIGLVAIVRPSRAALAAVAGTAGACALVIVGDLGDGGRHWTQALTALPAVIVTALAAWLAVRSRAVEWRKSDYVPVLGAAGLVGVLTLGYAAAQLLWLQPASFPVMQTLAGAPLLWASLAAIGGALASAPHAAVRGGGVATLLCAVLINLGVRVGDLEALSRSIAPPSAESRPLPRVASIPLPPYGGSLRVSPLGSRIAVARRPSPPDSRRRFLVLGVSGGRAEIEAHDLSFIDEDNAVVVVDATDGARVQHIAVAGRPEVAGTWQVVLPGVRGLRLSSVQGSSWAGLGYDATTEEHIGVTGRIGASDVRRQRLGEDDAADIGIVALAPDGRGLRTTADLTSLARLPWAGLLYMGRLPRQSQIWRVDGDRQPQLIAALPTHVTCQLVGRELATAVCVGPERSRTLVWRFDIATAPAAPLIVAGRWWRSAVGRDGRMVALWTHDAVLMVDLDGRRANRWTVSHAPGYPIDVVPAGDRLLALTYAAGSASVDVYDARWTTALLPPVR